MSLRQRLACLAFLALSSPNVMAWDGMTTGHIRTIDVTGGDNYGFRVSLEGMPFLCGNSHTCKPMGSESLIFENQWGQSH